MRNFLLAFFFLFAGLVQAYEVKLDTFETVPGRKKRSIVRELVKHLPDSDIVIIHNRPDEIWRDDGDLEWKYQWTFNFLRYSILLFSERNADCRFIPDWIYLRQ